MIIVGIDQVTITALISGISSLEDWAEKSSRVIHHIERALSLMQVFGKRASVKGPAPYTAGFEYGTHPFYFRIGHHPMTPSIGIIIKFSAHALEYYRVRYKELFGTDADLNVILQKLEDDVYADGIVEYFDYKKVKYRCSRIDVSVDFIDEMVSVTDLYTGLTGGSYSLRYEDGRVNPSGLHGWTKEDVFESFNIGAVRQRNQRALLRIYDKKTEEMKNPQAFRRDTALQCNDWVRFEAEYHDTYAHELTEVLRETNNTDLEAVLVAAVINRYTIWDNKANSFHRVTADLIKIREEHRIMFSSRVESDASIQKRVEHMIKKSGLIPLMYHIKSIWGDAGIAEFKELVDNHLVRHVPSRKNYDWLMKHKPDLVGTEIPFKLHKEKSKHD